MNRRAIVITLLAVVFSRAVVPGQEATGKGHQEAQGSVSLVEPKATVTYVANEGFLVRTANSKILVDALFGGIKGNWCEHPGDSLQNLMIRGQAPFDKIDVVLISDYHVDHFNAKLVTEFMENQTKTILLCPEQVDQRLRKQASYPLISERVRVVQGPDHKDTTFVAADILVNAMMMSHGGYLEMDSISGEMRNLHQDVQNTAWLVKADSVVFFHSGDASVKAFDPAFESRFSTEQVDFAFMDRVFMQPSGMEVIGGMIKPGKLIFMHIEPSRVDYYKNIIRDFPDMIIFSKPLESKVL